MILAVGLGSFWLVGPDDGVDEDARVALQPTGNVRPDDFFGNLDLAGQDDAAEPDGGDDAGAVGQDGAAGDNPDQGNPDEVPTAQPDEIAERIAILPSFGETDRDVGASLSGRQAIGTAPGLYAGHRQTQTCDVERLVELLANDDNAAKAQAWFEVLEIKPPPESDQAITERIARLTPVRLRLDTRVTNHGFRNGRAAPFQAILQSGSAVMVNDRGVPRLACSSGNPLTPPAPLGDLKADEALEVGSIAQDADMAWLGLDPAQVVTVTPAEQPNDVFVIVNIETGGLLERPVGTNGQFDLGTGDFQATLRWDSPADLDLEVVEPNGTTINHESRSPASSKGQLDVDANSRCEAPRTGVENVFWPDGDAASGDYRVIVRGFAVGDDYAHDCGGNTAEYMLTIKVFGQDDQVHEDSVGDGEADEYPVTIE